METPGMLRHREEELQWSSVVNCVNTVWVLNGAPGSGKSFSIKMLLRKLYQKNATSCNVAVLSVKPGNMQDLHNDLNDIRNQFGVDVLMVGQLAEKGARSFYHFLIIDECQDIIPGLGSKYLEVELLCKCLVPNGSVVLMGDDRQILNIECVSVMDVARAFSSNLQNAQIKQLPAVNVTRRCPEVIVSLANAVESGQAIAPYNDTGVVDYPTMYRNVTSGDLIVTPSAMEAAKIAHRVMKESGTLRVRLAYNYATIELLRLFLSHIQCLVTEGTITSMETLQDFFVLNHAESSRLYDKLFSGRAYAWGVWRTFMELVTGLCSDYDFKDLSTFPSRISLLNKCLARNGDLDRVVTIGTVEDTKGSSANRVFFIDPHKLRANAGKSGQQLRWEKHVRNHLFVGITRSKGDFFLVFDSALAQKVSSFSMHIVLKVLSSVSLESFEKLAPSEKICWQSIFGGKAMSEEVQVESPRDVQAMPDQAFVISGDVCFPVCVPAPENVLFDAPMLGIGPTGVAGGSANAVASSSALSKHALPRRILSQQMDRSFFSISARRSMSVFHNKHDNQLQKLSGVLREEGIAFMEAKQFEKAIDRFNQCIELDPSSHILFEQRAFAHMQLKNFEQCIADCDGALLLTPGSSVALRQKANALVAVGKTTEALACIEQAKSLQNAQSKEDNTRFPLKSPLLVK